MSKRTAPAALAQEQEPRCLALPQARDVLRPELLAGASGAPLEWARRFHQSFFDEVHNAITDRCVLVLPDVVIGRPDPFVREIQRWGGAVEPWNLTRLTSAHVARELTRVPGIERTIRTAHDVFLPAFEASPHLGDVELRRSMSAAMCMTTSHMLDRVAPYVRVDDASVVAYRPSSVLRSLARLSRGDQES